MRMDSSGDAGFMEAMVAFMVVTIVLTGFMGALATTTVTTADPTGSLDPDRFQGTLEGALYTRSVPGTVTDEFGREVPAVFEVAVAV